MTRGENLTAQAQIQNPTEADERQYHQQVTQMLSRSVRHVHDNVVARHDEMTAIKQQLQDQARDLDHADKASMRQAADMASRVGEFSIEQRRKLERLLASPYFGRIDCILDDAPSARPIYIGVHSFSKNDTEVVHDWRAPISSMFYDYELGEASFESPSGRIDSQITLKRQYRIENRQFRFMLESALNIQDNVLQEELSRASDSRLKTIVATIQRDQNAIIRNEDAHTLVIQGAAGSGKTSIAMHRIAFLLYKFKDTIRSEDILIISPNKVFAHYISQVLPELGEDMIRETTMETLADDLLSSKYRFQTFGEQIGVLLKNKDPDYAARVKFKADKPFLKLLDRYIGHVRSCFLKVAPVRVGFIDVDATLISQLFHRRGNQAPNERLNGVINAVVEHLKFAHQKSVEGKQRAKLRADLKAMVGETDLKKLYRGFYDWMERPEMFKAAAKGRLEYADVFPLVYMKLALEGVAPDHSVKHILVDEMQDYTPLQYRILARLYPCRKTVLGDRNQAVNPLSASQAESIRDALPDAVCVYMNKSYRSTWEITKLAQTIVNNPDLEPIQRHGKVPSILGFSKKKDELAAIREQVSEFAACEWQSLGIICRTQTSAEQLFNLLQDLPEVYLLDEKSSIFSKGVVIATAYLAKGLEFDAVLVPFCTATEFQQQMDRHLLYVAVTRAMHELTITYTGDATQFIAD